MREPLDSIGVARARLAALNGKLKVREGKAEFKDNVRELQAEISATEERIASMERAALASKEKPD